MPAVRAAVRRKATGLPQGVKKRRRGATGDTKKTQSARRRLTRERLTAMGAELRIVKDALEANGDVQGSAAWRRCAAKLARLMNHARNAHVTLNGNDGFTVTEPRREKSRRYTGLTKRLKARWWPDTNENPRARGKADRTPSRSGAVSRSGIASRSAFVVPTPASVRTCATSGAEHGSLVHDQLHRAVGYMRTLGAKEGTSKFMRSCRTPDPCVLRVLDVLAAKGWTPVASEFKIWNEDWRVATAIDLLCVDVVRGLLILIELKNGFEGEEYGVHAVDKPLSAPLESLRDCPMHRHQLQLLCMRLMLSERYGVEVDHACIILTRSKACDTLLIDEDPWCKDEANRRAVYAAMMRGGA